MKLPQYQGDGACPHLDQVRKYNNVAGAQREPSCQVEKNHEKDPQDGGRDSTGWADVDSGDFDRRNIAACRTTKSKCLTGKI
jgi:hypothetical protein